MKKEPWNLQQPYMPVVSETVKMRYRLAPYIYTAAREAYETGVSMCRPLYYDYPEEQRAYSEREEFMFGDIILATAICQPADSLTGMARRNMWFPKGCDWYDMAKIYSAHVHTAAEWGC